MNPTPKSPRARSEKIRRWAQGHEAGCQIRLAGCQWGPTVGSHIPKGVALGKGMGRKPPDILIALACDYCHKIVDGGWTRTSMTSADRMLAWYEGLGRTLVLPGHPGAQG